MRFERTPQFDRDFKALKAEHKRQFRDAIPDFNDACDSYADAHAESSTADETMSATHKWPAALRVHPMRSAPGVWEMTWSFASPDGRATFEFVKDNEGLILRWRRVGDHGIYKKP